MASNTLHIGKKNFKPDTYITIENKMDKEEFYIIRDGSVKTEQQTDEGEPIEEILEQGDYFGIISCMSGHPRTESVVSLDNVDLFVVAKEMFGPFIQKHPKAAIKMLHKMSKQLREYDEELSQRTDGDSTAVPEESEEDAGEGLIEVANYYYDKKRFNQALYAYVRYVEYHKDGQHFDVSKQRIAELSELAQDALNKQNDEKGLARTYKNDTFLFCEHEPGDELFIIQEGKVKITKVEGGQEALLAVVEAGAPIGEMAILENKPRSASAIAFGEVKALAVNQDNFEAMVQSQPQMGSKIVTTLSERIWATYRHLSSLRIADPLARLWDVLLFHCQRHRIPIKKGKSHTFAFGPKELIEYAMLPQDKGKLYFKEMYENKKLVLEDNNIKIEDLEALQQEVDFYRNKMNREQKIAKRKKA